MQCDILFPCYEGLSVLERGNHSGAMECRALSYAGENPQRTISEQTARNPVDGI